MQDKEKKYILHCNKCPYKRITDGTDLEDLIQVKTVDLQRGLPKLDPEGKTVIQQPPKKRTKIFRCPKCGFSLKAYSLDNGTKHEQ
jgi:DNA-directed RNA polymerase subunit M/transcription elongation factor TFIIS